MSTIQDWDALRVRAGQIVRAEPNEGSRDPAISLWIDFGALGELQSSAKIAERYRPDDLIGTFVIAVTDFEPVRVGGFRSDVLVLGAVTPAGVVLVRPDEAVEPGTIVA